MAKGRLLAIITALMLSAGIHNAQATYNFSQLEQIEQFIVNGEWELLLNYLEANPEVLEGVDALAVELREFVAQVETGGVISIISAPAAVPDLSVVEEAKDSY